jgi:biotin operon repressor
VVIASSASTPRRSEKPEVAEILAVPPLLVDDYRAGRCSLSAIAADLGCSRTAVRREFSRQGVMVRRPGRPRGRSHLRDVLTDAFLRAEYVDARRSSVELAAELGCSHKTVLRYLAAYGIEIRGRGSRGGGVGGGLARSYLRTRYLEEGARAEEIAAEVGCSRSSVFAALARYDISRRRRGVGPDGAAVSGS